VMPSLDVARNARQNKLGKNAGKYSIVFCNRNAAGQWVPRPKWETYERAFHLIEHAQEAGKISDELPK
jgi:hypothetical protein